MKNKLIVFGLVSLAAGVNMARADGVEAYGPVVTPPVTPPALAPTPVAPEIRQPITTATTHAAFRCAFGGAVGNKAATSCLATGRFGNTEPPLNTFVSGTTGDFIQISCANGFSFSDSIVYGVVPVADDIGTNLDTQFLTNTPFVATVSVRNLNWTTLMGAFPATLRVSFGKGVPTIIPGACEFRNNVPLL